MVMGPRRNPETANTAESEMASRNTGNAQSMSNTQRRTASTGPPRAPASTPIVPPAKSESTVANAAIDSDVRPP